MLVANLFYQIDTYMFAVEVATEAEYMGFEQSCVTIHRGAVAHIRHSLISHPVNLNRRVLDAIVDALNRARIDVGCRKTHLAPELRSVNNLSRDSHLFRVKCFA